MSLSSESIQKKEFHIVFKGYKPEEVDKFLDMLAMEFDGMHKKIRELEEKVDGLKYEGDNESSKMKKVIQEALISAHRMAEEIKQKAKIEAEELVSKRKMEQEQELRDLQDEKTALESSITKLKDEYARFKEQISRFADDFKQKTMSLISSKSADALQEPGPGTGSTGNPITDSKTGPSESSPAGPVRGEEVLYKHARKDEDEENIDDNELKDLAALTDEMLEKLDKKDQNSYVAGKSSPEKQDETEEKRNRKKIDIANPDIINDFFKTDDD